MHYRAERGNERRNVIFDHVGTRENRVYPHGVYDDEPQEAEESRLSQ